MINHKLIVPCCLRYPSTSSLKVVLAWCLLCLIAWYSGPLCTCAIGGGSFQAHCSRTTGFISAHRSMCESCRFLVGPEQTEAKQGKNWATYSEYQPSSTPANWRHSSIQWTNNTCSLGTLESFLIKKCLLMNTSLTYAKLAFFILGI